VRARVLVIDDKPSMREMLATVLGLEHDVSAFGDPREALKAFAADPFDLVVSDVRMPELDGLEVLKRVKSVAPDVEVILMTAYGTVAQAVEAVKAGAFHYILKPFEPDEVRVAVARGLAHRDLARRARRLEREVEERRGFERLVGESRAMAEVRVLIDKVAPADVTALVTGPTGTGKELVARAIHERGPRASGPFVVVHCAAIPKDLIESELFGHMKGAFSGATTAKRGMVEEAEGGTLFLDDVNYLDLGLQAKVNRLVQEKEFKPLGATSWRKTDTRIVAAANVDLAEAVRRGEFREDLFHRLNVFPIRVPPLAGRREDIPLLARHFVEKHGRRLNRPNVQLTKEAVERLRGAPWRGNIRELENAIERALLLAEGAEIGARELPGLEPESAAAAGAARGTAAVAVELPYAQAIEAATADAARAYLQAVLARFGGNVTQAAKHAGVARQYFHRLLAKHGIEAGEVRRSP